MQKTTVRTLLRYSLMAGAAAVMATTAHPQTKLRLS